MSSTPPPAAAAAASASAPTPAAAAPPAPAAGTAPAATAPTATTAASSKTKATKSSAKATSKASSKSKKSTSKTPAKASGAGTNAKKKTAAATAAATARKRKTTKATSAASQQAIANDARTAAAHLSQQQANSLARRTDPLWYRMEDCIAVNATGSKPPGYVEDFHALENALHSHGKTRADLTPQALACLMEHTRRYRQELMMSAKKYAEAAGRTEVAKPDLQLAAELRHDYPVALASQIPKLNLLAEQLNRKPLPPIPDTYSGVKLPPPPHQITARTFDVLTSAATAQKMLVPYPQAPKHSSSTNNSSDASSSQAVVVGAYGAARGRQIPVKLKSKSEPKTATMTAASSSSLSLGGPAPMDISSPSAAAAAVETIAATNASNAPQS